MVSYYQDGPLDASVINLVSIVIQHNMYLIQEIHFVVLIDVVIYLFGVQVWETDNPGSLLESIWCYW